MKYDKETLKIPFNISLGQRLVLFLCVTLFCFVVASFIIGLLVHFKGQTTAMLRISAVLQDVLMFILPAVATAIIITRYPASFLEVQDKPKAKIWISSCLVLVLSIPAMNALVVWNESIHLPESLSGLESWMREAEENAATSVNLLLSGSNFGSVLLSILIVGVFAGLSEELFFRGTFQRLLTTARMNHHFAIWLVAFLFSASHLQFYGFFGRLLLGAYFGYLLYWTKCLWVPVIVHIFNNTVYILGNKLVADGDTSTDINTYGSSNALLIVISIILTFASIFVLKKYIIKSFSDDNITH